MNVDFSKYNSVQPLMSGEKIYVLGRLIEGNAQYWVRNEQRGSGWVDKIDNATADILPVMRGFARALENVDVVNRNTGKIIENLEPSSAASALQAETPSTWNAVFVDISGRTSNPAKRGTCLEIKTQHGPAGYVRDPNLNFGTKVIELVPLAYAHAFSSRDVAVAYVDNFRNGEEFNLALGEVRFTATTPRGDAL